MHAGCSVSQYDACLSCIPTERSRKCTVDLATCPGLVAYVIDVPWCSLINAQG